MMKDLVYDVGMHRGEDTRFYLAKGFRVVAIEADPRYCQEVEHALSEHVRSGRLRIVNAAISPSQGKIKFYRNLDVSVWGTTHLNWAQRNERLGTNVEEIEVPSTSIDEVFRIHGIPYYLKIDIEGSDLLCLQGLRNCQSRPRYVSLESNKISFGEIESEFKEFQGLGYGRFKIVAQHEVCAQQPPSPSLEGEFVDYTFHEGASGLFGEEAPGEWIDARAALKRYRKILRRYRWLGDDPLVKPAWLCGFLRTHGFPVGWYDTHAKLSDN